MTDVLIVVALGFAGGAVGGLVGVGGGVLFVPALVIFLDEAQVRAEASSLLAIVVVAAVGAWRQQGYGNVRMRDAVTIGVLSVAGATLGVIIANEVPQRALEIAFAALILLVAGQLARRALAPAPPTDRARARP